MTTQQLEHLVKMAREIALNLGAGHDSAAAEKTAEHIRRFWTPRMRRQIMDYWQGGGSVDPGVAASLSKLQTQYQDGSEEV